MSGQLVGGGLIPTEHLAAVCRVPVPKSYGGPESATVCVWGGAGNHGEAPPAGRNVALVRGGGRCFCGSDSNQRSPLHTPAVQRRSYAADLLPLSRLAMNTRGRQMHAGKSPARCLIPSDQVLITIRYTALIVKVSTGWDRGVKPG